jgi:hypothetical protein
MSSNLWEGTIFSMQMLMKMSNFLRPGEDFSLIWNGRIVDIHSGCPTKTAVRLWQDGMWYSRCGHGTNGQSALTRVSYPACSPDFAICDLWLFGYWKRTWFECMWGVRRTLLMRCRRCWTLYQPKKNRSDSTTGSSGGSGLQILIVTILTFHNKMAGSFWTNLSCNTPG